MNPTKLNKITCNSLQLILLVILLALIGYLIYAIVDKYSKKEGFDNDPSMLDTSINIGKQIQNAKSDAEISELVQKMMSELIAVGAVPDTNKFATKNDIEKTKCMVATAMDRDQYVAKSSIPAPGPRIDMSQYIKKSAIPACPERKCPEQVDLSGYVKKSSLFMEKNQPCIAPKVKVSAGLCKKCPPCPTANCPVCPTPKELKCPEPKPCPPAPQCPPPQPCPTLGEQPVRYEVKYIKVPTIITKTVVVDQNNNVLSQNVSTDGTNVPSAAMQETTANVVPMATKLKNTATTSMATLPNANESCLLSSTLNSAYARSGGLTGATTA